MSLSIDGVWKSGVWDETVWADGVWREGEPVEAAASTTRNNARISFGARLNRESISSMRTNRTNISQPRPSRTNR